MSHNAHPPPMAPANPTTAVAAATTAPTAATVSPAIALNTATFITWYCAAVLVHCYCRYYHHHFYTPVFGFVSAQRPKW